MLVPVIIIAVLLAIFCIVLIYFIKNLQRNVIKSQSEIEDLRKQVNTNSNNIISKLEGHIEGHKAESDALLQELKETRQLIESEGFDIEEIDEIIEEISDDEQEEIAINSTAIEEIGVKEIDEPSHKYRMGYDTGKSGKKYTFHELDQLIR